MVNILDILLNSHRYIRILSFELHPYSQIITSHRYLDVAGHKNSKIYLYNGFAMFFGWLFARIILFIYILTDMYIHLDQVSIYSFRPGIRSFVLYISWFICFLLNLQIRMVVPIAFYSLLFLFPVLTGMNVYWFWKILHGLFKTISKRHVNWCFFACKFYLFLLINIETKPCIFSISILDLILDWVYQSMELLFLS